VTGVVGGPQPAEIASPPRSAPPTTHRSTSPVDRLTRGRLTQLLDDPPETTATSPIEGGGGRWPRCATAIDAHPLITDTALAFLLAVISTPWLLRQARPGLGSWMLQVALLVPVIWRRRYPVGVFATLSAIAILHWLLADPLVADLSLLVPLYTVAVHRPRRTALAAAAVLEVGVIMATVRWTLAESWIRSLVFLSTMVAAAISLGMNVRGRRAHLAAPTERAERLEHERDQQGRLAVIAERTRIAREMHDVLATAWRSWSPWLTVPPPS